MLEIILRCVVVYVLVGFFINEIFELFSAAIGNDPVLLTTVV